MNGVPAARGAMSGQSTGRRGGGFLGIGVAVWLLVAGTAGAEAPAAARLVAADAAIYAELGRPGAAIDRVTDERFRRMLDAVPGYADALKRDDVRHLRAVVDFVANTLGTTAEKGLRDLTGGGIVLAVEGSKAPERVFVVVTPGDPAFLARALSKLLQG